MAATGADYNAGYIIDDLVFNNKAAMSVQQIQDFLNAKVPVCDNWGTQPYAGTTRRAYSEARGEIFPLICVKEYYENTTTKENNLQGHPIPAGAISAAQIIWNASQAYNINPQVLIVLLQKEQGLITDDWPWYRQYRSATGYGCPDSAPCDAQYYGFYNQVTKAAWQFRQYANNPNNYNHIPNQNNFIRWSPDPSCGGSTVFIRNQATASLYNYTPYQPNQAALNNMYGSGDSCSSYGNRNFLRYFIDWFGSPYVLYSWTTVSQYAYYDNTKQLPASLGALGPGQRYYLVVNIRNTGNVTWQNSGPNPVNLGTANPQDRASPFCDSTWIGPAPGCNRTVALGESSVAPGQVGSFSFWVKTPSTPGKYNELYTPVTEGVAWMSNSTISFPMAVNPPTFSWKTTGQYAYTDSTKTSTAFDLAHLTPGQRYYLGVKVKNTGDMAWRNVGSQITKLGSTSPKDRTSPFCDSTWESCTRAAMLKEAVIYPGQIGSFEFWITAPSTGNYKEYLAPVVETSGGNTWMSGQLITFKMGINPYTWAAGPIRFFTNNTKQTAADPTRLDPGQRYYMTVGIQNTGASTWHNTGSNPVALGTANSTDHSSKYCDPTWLGCNRPARLHENTIGPGQISYAGSVGSFEFWITAPANPGNYVESFTPLVEGLTWMGTSTIDVPVKVSARNFSWTLINQYAFTSSDKTTSVNLGDLQPGQRYYLTMALRNDGNFTWYKTGPNPMRLGTASPEDRVSPFCDSTWLGCNRPTAIHEYTISPRQIGSFEFWITAPATKASYNEIYAPVMEGVSWLDSHTVSFPMIVR